MKVTTACPDAAILRNYLLGRTPEATAAGLEDHLAACPECRKRLPAVQAEDEFVAEFRAQAATPEPASPLLDRLADRLHGLVGSLPGGDATTPADALATTSSAPAARETTRDNGPSLAPAQQPDEIGRLGGYRILKELGRGGMGVVYQAEDVKLKRLVALKAMLPNLAADAASRQRFLREAQAMAAVHHDHVVTIHAVDEAHGVPFLAMEFLEGMPLDQWLKQGRKPTIAQVLRIGREIAEGLAAAHTRGLIHRDIKPGNVWLDSAHKGRVKILDFGLARAGQEDVHLTRSGAIVGTPAYMAPEQARGEKVDARGDLFSLGCVLYKLLTGAMPFTGDNTMSLLMSLALDQPTSVKERNADIPAELSDLVMKLLEKDPARRPASAREVVQALQALERQPARKQGAEDRTEALPIAILATPAPAPERSAAIASVPTAPRAVPPHRRVGALVGLLLGGAVVAAATVALVIIIRDKDGNKVAEVNVPPGGKAEFVDDAKKDDAAVAPKAAVDDAWVKQVAALYGAKQVDAVAAKLKELNPGFDGKVGPDLDLYGTVVGLTFLADNVTDISPVKALPGLQMFTCTGSNNVIAPLADLSPLKGMPLEALNISGTHVSDLSPLKGMKLKQLTCGYTRVSDLSPLKGMPLTYLWCGSTKVSDLSPLKGMPLESLTVDGLVSDLSPLKGLPLTELNCGGLVSDLSPLKDMPLRSLNCGGAKIFDLSPLKGMPLVWLACDRTQVVDLSPLKDTKLTTLECSATKVSDLSPLKDMKLTSLGCKNTPVSDLSPLKGMKLTALGCGATKVSDLSPLKGMPLGFLDCTNMQVSDLSPLKGMPLNELHCDFKPERDGDVLRSIPTLERINDTPAAEFWKQVDAAAKPPVDDAWIKQVAALPADKQVEAVVAELKSRNPGFDGQVTPTIDSGVVVGLLFVTDNITDISPVRALTGLQMLTCSGSNYGKGKLADLSPLKDMKLTYLDCSGTPVSDLSPLKDMKLTSLICPNTQVSDLSPLKDMPLTTLWCGGSRVSDLSPLKGLPLARLGCNNTPVSDLSPLKGLKLTYLECHDTMVSDLAPLKDMPLTTLWCGGSRVSDLSPLKGMKLTNLQINVTPVFDLSPLKGMKLTILNCDATQVSDLSPLKDMPLTTLWCGGSRVSDLSPLKGLPLATLGCNNTPVSDLSPLKGMKLTNLNCDATKVSDLSPLKGMPLGFLDCTNTQVSDLSPLKGMPLKDLRCDFKPERDADILRSIKTLETINEEPAADFWKDVDAKKP